jgi:hypothetical protein
MTALVEKLRFQIILRIVILRAWRKADIPWKVDVTGKPVRDSTGELVLDFYPKSITEFCKWTGANNCPNTRDILYSADDLESFLGAARLANLEHWPATVSGRILDLAPLSRTTINQPWHQKLKERADSELLLVETKAQTQRETNNKLSIIDGLKAEILYLKGVVEEQEKEARASRSAERAAIANLKKAEELHARNTAEVLKNNANLDATVAELRKKLAVVFGLTAVATDSK